MKTFREYLKTFFPLRVFFSGEGEGGNGMRVEEDAGGGNATVATSSDLGELLPDSVKESRCPFYGTELDSERGVLVITGEDVCCVAVTADSNVQTCLLKAREQSPGWPRCMHMLTNPDASGIIESFKTNGISVVIPPKSSEDEIIIPFSEWFDYCQ